MRTIRDLASLPLHIAGRIERIVVRGAVRAPARSVDATRALAGIGLPDDRLGVSGEADRSTRQVTLIQHEHPPVIAQLARVAAVDALGLRRFTATGAAARRCQGWPRAVAALPARR
ncbi:MAG: hypothetical protein U5L03_10530 [Burkholderiaceae bacterium]|nr:hypothetical protein [Burkholderiaceae bacterium]